MFDIIIAELKKGKIELLELFGNNEIYDLFNSIKSQTEKEELLSIILPKLKKTKDWYSKIESIFDIIYLNENYEEYTCYLLQTNLEKDSSLTPTQIENLLTKKTWGLSYIMQNLEEIINAQKIYPEPLIEIIVNQVKDNQDLLNNCINRFLYSKHSRLREEAIFYLAKNNLLPNKELVVAALYNNPADFLNQTDESKVIDKNRDLLLSDLPYLISAIKDSDYQVLIKKYYSLFFAAESKRKLHFIKRVGYISKEIEEKYQEILRLAEDPMVFTNLDFILSAIINANEGDFIIDRIKGKDVEFGGMGTTRKVLKVGDDSILKFARHLYSDENVTEHFLLCPNKLKKITVSNSTTIYIEEEPYLSKTHNGRKMTEQDIENFLMEANKQGLVITDPLCLSKDNDNFGFLKSYKDATLAGVNSYDELPDWFKERPIVLYDIDLVTYKKDQPKSLIKNTKN